MTRVAGVRLQHFTEGGGGGGGGGGGIVGTISISLKAFKQNQNIFSKKK